MHNRCWTVRLPAVLIAFFALAPDLGAQATPATPATPSAADTVQANLRIARSDLRNLVVAQEAYFADHAKYATKMGDLAYVPTRESTIELLVTEPHAWSARLTRPRLRGSCVIWVGVEEAKRPRTAADRIMPGEGEPRCDAQPELPAAAAPARP